MENDIAKQDTIKKKKKRPGRWKKGESGNPKGRKPSGETIADFFRAFVEELDPVKKKERRLLLLEKAYKQALAGNKESPKYMELLFNRAYGRPQETIDLKGEITYTVKPREKK